jgi:hypothetical protein
VLGSPSTAAQFQIVSGQLTQYLPGSSSVLYAHVEPRADSSVVKLKVTWATTPDSGDGTFFWSGDTLQWQSKTISRPALNVSACGCIGWCMC